MTRKELANAVFVLMRKDGLFKDKVLWKAIAETDDNSLLDELERLQKNYSVKENV